VPLFLTNQLQGAESSFFLNKLTVPQLVKKFTTFYRNRTLITVFTKARHLSLLRTRSIQPMPFQTISLKSVLKLSSHLRLGLGSVSFPTNTLYAPLPSPAHAANPSHLIPLDRPDHICWGIQIMEFLTVAVFATPQLPLRPKYLPQCPNPEHPLSLGSFLNIRDQVSHQYKNNRQNYSCVYFNNYILDIKQDAKTVSSFDTEITVLQTTQIYNNKPKPQVSNHWTPVRRHVTCGAAFNSTPCMTAALPISRVTGEYLRSDKETIHRAFPVAYR
jgi:hypothetical protein